MVCENINNQTVCEVSLTLTEPITRDMHQSEVKCVYADDRDDIEKGKPSSEELDSPATKILFRIDGEIECSSSSNSNNDWRSGKGYKLKKNDID